MNIDYGEGGNGSLLDNIRGDHCLKDMECERAYWEWRIAVADYLHAHGVKYLSEFENEDMSKSERRNWLFDD